jgi:hypothetical protein
MDDLVERRQIAPVTATPAAGGMLLEVGGRVITFVLTVLQLFVLCTLLTFTLRRFPYTRPRGETLRESMLARSRISGWASCTPSRLFTVLVILIIARAVTLLLVPWFTSGRARRGPRVVDARGDGLHHAPSRHGGRLAVRCGDGLPLRSGQRDRRLSRHQRGTGPHGKTLGSSGLVNQVMSSFVVTYSRRSITRCSSASSSSTLAEWSSARCGQISSISSMSTSCRLSRRATRPTRRSRRWCRRRTGMLPRPAPLPWTELARVAERQAVRAAFRHFAFVHVTVQASPQRLGARACLPPRVCFRQPRLTTEHGGATQRGEQ